jgi:arylamine N-acetyltransferase
VFDRYLKLLGARPEKPGIGSLTELIRAHLLKVPFENLSKLYYLKKIGLKNIPDMNLYLDGIENIHFGGTCYCINYYFHLLLKHLGYDADLCGADMDKPNVHLVSRVRLDGREFLVDVGYAAPFGEPMPLDLSKDLEITAGSDRYVLNPKDEKECSEMTLYRDGVPHHGYRVNPQHREIGFFSKVIADSFQPESTFMKCLLLVRHTGSMSVVIHNTTYIEREIGQERRQTFHTKEELVHNIEKIFYIPKPVINQAIEDHTITGNAWH